MAIQGIGFDYFGVTAHDLEHPDPKILTLVARLRSNGYRVGLISNLAAEWIPAFRATGIEVHFDAVVLSGESGFAKPDHRAFQLLAERLDVSLDELVVIDDQPGSFLGTENLPIIPVLFEDYASLMTVLAGMSIRLSE